MKILTVLVLVLLLYAGEVEAQGITEIGKEEITALTRKSNDTTYVVNFWATWCSPCVKEIGYFDDLYRDYSGENLKVILVSLDFPNQVERRVIPFLRERNIGATVLLMGDLDYNGWIDRVDPSWSGAIPATLIYKGEERIFLEKELTREELYDHVHQMRN